ncbi:serine hydrolase [Litoribacter alkaliphilus]|uniref:Serine hydrolase n=1 Tax=Litoribacter ruber TaxID=702568 RepID=A0AAP2G287_9BACT|nr:serine hydrolase [Litoribacter alkaliphilus]MBS9525784.1 serine hydrolase [Litoribacter alkaliphilus]
MKYIYCFLLTLISTSIFGQLISEELDSEIKRRVKLEINPSFSIGILLPDGTTKYYGYGYYDDSRKHPDSLTLYEIGSVTKTFTAELANTYLKDSLNKPLSTFFVGVENPKLDSITPYKLQNHIAGIPRLSNQFSPKNWSDPFNGYSNIILQEELRDLDPDTSNNWSYSNFGYGILGRVIEIVSGKSYENLMGGLLQEIGIDNTFLSLPTQGNQKIAMPTNIRTSNSNWNFTGPSRYSGGLVSNTKDLLSYLNFQRQNNPLFLSDSLQNPIQTRVSNLGKDKLFYKDGWFVLMPDSTTNIITHNGGTGGFISFVGYNKTTEFGVVVLSNSVNMVDDIGINILYPTFKLSHPERTIAYELAGDIDAGNTDNLVNQFNILKNENYPNNIIDIYWLERFHFGKSNYLISNQLSDIMVKELPKDWEVYDIKGQNLQKLKYYKKAIIFYEKALELNPENESLKNKINLCKKMYNRNTG